MPFESISGGAYEAIVNECADGCGCTGGAIYGSGRDDENVVLSDLAKYNGTPNSMAKDKLIKGLIGVMKGLGIHVAGRNESEVLKELLSKIPNRKSNGKSFKADALKHEKLCKDIAREINNQFPTAKIDESAQAERLCQQVSQFIYSLSAGVRNEYVAIANDVKQVLLNIIFVRNAIQEQEKDIAKRIENSSDPQLQAASVNNTVALAELEKELTRQFDIIRNIINVDLSKDEMEAAKKLTEKDKLFGMIEGFDKQAGSALFSDYLSNILTATVVTAQYADIINKALKTIGLKMDDWKEYVKNSNFKGLQDKLSNLLIDAKADDKEKSRMIQASELLVKNFYRGKEINDAMKSGAYEGDNIMESDSTMESSSADLYSMNDNKLVNVLDKRVQNKKVIKDLIFVAFNRKFATLIDTFADTVDTLMVKIGQDMPITDQLDGLYQSLKVLDDEDILKKHTGYFALVGYYKDARSQQAKHQFVSRLDVCLSYLETMMQMSVYSKAKPYLQDTAGVIKQIKQHIEDYAEKVSEKFGSGAIQEAEISGGFDCDDSAIEAEFAEDSFTGGAAPSLLVNPDNLVLIRKSVNKLDRSLSKFSYYYKAAQMRHNLGNVAKEIDHYSENYDDVLGSAIAVKIDDVRKDYTRGNDTAAVEQVLDRAALKTAKSDSNEAAAAELLREQMEVRVKFWQTLETMDHYLKHFTAGLVKNPNDVKEIASMLEDVSLIENWYNKSTGMALHQFYDSFGGQKELQADSDDHYYELVAKYATIGNVDTAISAKDFKEKAKPKLVKVMDSFRMLKNLMSVFTYIGEKFGNDTLYKKITMTPTQIYKNMMTYFQVSSYTVNTTNYEVKIKKIGAQPLTQALVVPPSQLINSGFETNHTKEDEYFVMLVKSMCAKVLTVIGLYDCLDRPMEISYMSSIRMVLGAGDDTPKIENKAVELYLRLPLLVEFYRDLFGFTNGNSYEDGDGASLPPQGSINEQKIVMLPEMEGTFSGIIELVFRKNRGVYLQSYTDEDLKDLIREVNVIYAKMSSKYPETFVNETINELVQEVNRRYGLIKKDSVKKYIENFSERFGYAGKTGVEYKDNNDYPILPDENDYDVERPNPSKKYETGALDIVANAKKDLRFQITREHQNLFYKFRCMLDNLLIGDKQGDVLNGSSRNLFKPAIRSAAKKLAITSGDDEKFKVISQLVRGSQLLTQTEAVKYVVFHETVVSGLNTLSAIYTILARFRMMAVATDAVSAHAGMSEDNLIKKHFGDNVDVARIKNADFWAGANSVYRGVDSEKMMAIFNTVFSVSKDLQGLVDVRLDDKLYLNWNGLKTVIEDLFTNVKYFIDLLRPQLELTDDGKLLVDKYLNKNTPGSYYYLQERLVEQLVVGRLIENVSGSTGLLREYKSLVELSKLLNESLEELLKSGQYGDAFAEQVFYGAKIDGGRKQLRDTSSPSKVDWLNQTSLEKLLVNVNGKIKRSFPGVAFRYKQLYDSNPSQLLTDNKSLMFSFNQLLAQYLYTFLDHTSNKMYIGLIDSFANGAFNSALNDVSRSFPDVDTQVDGADKDKIPLVLIDEKNALSYIDSKRIWELLPVELTKSTQAMVQRGDSVFAGIRAKLMPNAPAHYLGSPFSNAGDPKQNQILFTSLAVMLFNMLSSKDEKGELVYLERDLTAIPSYMKEKLRANLSGFKNLFKELIFKAELMKSFISHEDMAGKLSRSRASSTLDVIAGIELQKYNGSAEATKSVLLNVIAAVMSASSTMVSSIDQVMREIADEPKHSEFSRNSIEEFKNLYHKNPFMPISNSLYVMKNHNQADEKEVLPFNSLGDNSFKFAYANRATIHRMDTTPSSKMSVGYSDLIALYNSISDAKLSISADKADKLFQSLLKGIRYVHDVKNVKGAFDEWSSNTSIGKLDFISPAKRVGNNFETVLMNSTLALTLPNDKSSDLRISFALAKEAQDVAYLTESSAVEDRQKDIAVYISGLSGKSAPKDLRIQNILDLNIVPINVNAMMRELPLTNVYNYAYTFDRMIIELFYGIGSELAMDLIRNLCRQNGGLNYPAPPASKYNSDSFYGQQNLDRVPPAADVKSPASMLISLLVNPYKAIGDAARNEIFNNLMQGYDNSGLGRAKFLSDQVYGKLLFGSVYPVNNRYPIGPEYRKMDNTGSLKFLTNVKANTVPVPPSAQSFNTYVIKDSGIAAKPAEQSARRDTVLVRNLIFVVNAYRALCLKIERDLHYAGPKGNRDPVVRSPAFLDRTHTEFEYNENTPYERK